MKKIWKNSKPKMLEIKKAPLSNEASNAPKSLLKPLKPLTCRKMEKLHRAALKCWHTLGDDKFTSENRQDIIECLLHLTYERNEYDKKPKKEVWPWFDAVAPTFEFFELQLSDVKLL